MGRSLDVWHYFELAAQVASLKDDCRSHQLGAVGLRSDGALVCASNGPVRFSPRAVHHAEMRLCRKLDYYGTVFVARRLASGGWGLARPCIDCQRILRSRRVRRVYYTVNQNEYGVIDYGR